MSFALIYFFTKGATLYVLIWIRKNYFLKLSDLCELECGVNTEKYQYFLPFNSINSRKSNYYDELLFGSLGYFGRTGTELELRCQVDHTTFRLELIPKKRAHVRE